MVGNLQHIALIPDGNRRWAKQRGVPELKGHQAGAKTMHSIVDHLIDYDLKYLTVWGFSGDNWKRSKGEVSNLFNLLALWIKKDTAWLHKRNVRLRHIGRVYELPDYLQLALKEAGELTSGNRGMTLSLAFNYTGRGEIVDAIHNWLADKDAPSYLDEKVFSHYLYTDGIPDVDLVIRTAGEFRLSNFLLWQTAYSEFFFSEALWPDFNTEELEKALLSYAQRQRRFGGD